MKIPLRDSPLGSPQVVLFNEPTRMKIIQTLWCGNRELGKSPFWWLHAEYNLMSWALSCMSLNETFGNVTLYTDSEGARMLVDTLKLPYTEVKIVYDGFDCLTCHWALAKVKTYSMQTEPFLHIDGDIYLTNPLSSHTLDARLIAQNRETTTEYYRKMVRQFLSIEGLKLRPDLRSALEAKEIPSYNLGFCGGSDTAFFGKFHEEVSRFFCDNDFNGEKFRNADISANVIFEQMFFSAMARDEGVEIATVHPDTIRDNGYTATEFCDLRHFKQRPFLHILGGHKRNAAICRTLEQTLMVVYPEYYERIAALFPQRHKLMHGIPPTINADSDAGGYRIFLKEVVEKWRKTDKNALMETWKKTAEGATLMEKMDETLMLERNPYLAIYNVREEEREILCRQLKTSVHRVPAQLEVAVLPVLSSDGYFETTIDNLTHNILCLLNEPMPADLLTQKLLPFFTCHDIHAVRTCITKTLKHAVENGLVVFTKRYRRT